MKVCPNCNQRYTDDALNFCLNDGALLQELHDEPPPTVVMDRPRTTNPGSGWDTYQQPPPWQNQPNLAERPFQQPMAFGANDQTLATVSLIMGILSLITFCCYGGIPFGLAGVIAGAMAINQINKDPGKYRGRGMAVGGIVTGGIGVIIGLMVLLFAIVAG